MAKKKTSKKYPKRLSSQAAKLARAGRTDRQIAREINVPRRVVKTWTAREREARKRDRAARLARLGRDPKGIARRLDVSVAKVRRWLSQPNGHPRPRPKNSGARHGTDTRRCARRMAECDDPVMHIARVLDVTPKTVREWLRKMEEEDGQSLLPGGRQRVHDRTAILADVHAKDEDGNPLYTRREIREKYGCSHKFLSYLVNGRLDP